MAFRWFAGRDLLDGYVNKLAPTLSDSVGSEYLEKICTFGFFAGPVHFGPHGPNLMVLY